MSDATSRRFVLTLSCPDDVGIIARIANFLSGMGASIIEASYHSDPDTGWFFTRQVVPATSVPIPLEELRQRFAELAGELGAQTDARITDSSAPRKSVVLVSKESHCLHDLLGRAELGDLNMTVSAIIGNHAELQRVAAMHDIPFHHIPFPSAQDQRQEDRDRAFAELRATVSTYEPELIVLAKFMRILPADLCESWAGRAINIHHSFLPSFAGARPYQRAHERGVKLIGATCHYVTPELDAGPIIEQDVTRVAHGDSVQDLIRLGRDVERLVLARGVQWHLEDRVLIHGNKTVVFR